MAMNTQLDPDSDLAILVNGIVSEEVNAVRERRSAHRTSLVRPVQVQVSDEDSIYCFSRTISAQGMGLIMQTPPWLGTIATVHVHRLKGPPLVMRSELRWCEPFGDDWFATGWNFIAEVRGY
jgi:hypothetical protein